MGYFAGAATPAAPRARIGLVNCIGPSPAWASGPTPTPSPLDRKKLRQARRREGRYRPGSKLPGADPVQLWICDIQLTEVEQAFRELKGHLAIRAIYHPRDVRTEWRIHGSLSSGALRASKWVGLHHRHFACGDWIRDLTGGARIRVDGALGAQDGAVEPAGTDSRRASAARARARPRS